MANGGGILTLTDLNALIAAHGSIANNSGLPGVTDITAINAQTISVQGVPISGSGSPTGTVTMFDILDADAVLALRGVVLQGTLPPGGVFTNYTDINVNELLVDGEPYGGAPPGFVFLFSPVTNDRLLSPVTGGRILRLAA